MKRLFTIIASILLTVTIWAQSPQKMSYQCVVRNASGVLVINQGVGIRISILQGSTSGTVVYQETYNPNPQTNDNGLLSIEIGGGTPLTGIFSSVNWASGPYFLKTETDPTGSTNYTIIGTSQLLSVPYAMYAKNSETSTDAVKTTGNQTIAGNKTFTDTINASSHNITNVANPVNAQDAATKDYVDAIMQLLSQKGSIVVDVEGNIYSSVRIGSQVWMAENLKTTKFNDGTSIPLVTDADGWINNILPAYCWFNNDEATYKATYGAIYRWGAVSAGNLCPTGWHVPGGDEWRTLINYLGGTSLAIGKLKETGTTHWISPNTGSTNESGFTALPGGSRGTEGTFFSGNQGSWWVSSNSVNTEQAYIYILNDNQISGTIFMIPSNIGNSVRCVRGPELTPTISTLNVTNITSTTATSGGNISNEGAATVTDRGICCGTFPYPTRSLNKPTDGTGTGSFTSIITGLSPNTTYYVRAYAINSFGTSYGNAIRFTTNP